jgi:16S rRNA (cytosine1402-N4)-methyltransferase
MGGGSELPRRGSAAGVGVATGLRLPPTATRGPYWSGGALRLRDTFTRWHLTYASEYHVPVMVREVMHYLRPDRGGLILDGTLGGGGHAEAILDASDATRLIGVDRDPAALAEAGRRLARFEGRVRLLESTYAEAVGRAGLDEGSLAGVLLDLGISSRQVDEIRRGFTFRAGAPLDMRMGGAAGGGESAADILNDRSEEELASIFYRYGEERRSRRLARLVAEMRSEAPIERSEQLVEAIDRAIPRATVQDRARIFQALRIVVNREIEGLESALPKLREALAPGGVLVVLSYHSLEDRIVKDAFREWGRECVCPPGLPVCHCRGRALGTVLTRKPVMASQVEVESNSRARSARLRAWRKG